LYPRGGSRVQPGTRGAAMAGASNDRDAAAPAASHRASQTHAEPVADGVRDPVCGMTVDPHTTPHRQSHAGRTYYFCSARCREKFVAEPKKYLAPSDVEAAIPEGTIYTCPMHPQIRQPAPGACPICGMPLEPELASAEAAPNPELVDMTRRFWVALALSLPVFALEMGGHVFDLHRLIGPTASSWLQLLLATPVVLW